MPSSRFQWCRLATLFRSRPLIFDYYQALVSVSLREAGKMVSSYEANCFVAVWPTKPSQSGDAEQRDWTACLTVICWRLQGRMGLERAVTFARAELPVKPRRDRRARWNRLITLKLLRYETDYFRKEGCRDHLDWHGLRVSTEPIFNWLSSNIRAGILAGGSDGRGRVQHQARRQ